jgi:hypothetical protein
MGKRKKTEEERDKKRTKKKRVANAPVLLEEQSYAYKKSQKENQEAYSRSRDTTEAIRSGPNNTNIWL